MRDLIIANFMNMSSYFTHSLRKQIILYLYWVVSHRLGKNEFVILKCKWLMISWNFWLSNFNCVIYPVHLFIYPLFYLLTNQSVHSSIYPSIDLFTYQSICPFINLSIHWSIYLPIHLSIYQFIHPLIYLFIHLLIH